MLMDIVFLCKVYHLKKKMLFGTSCKTVIIYP